MADFVAEKIVKEFETSDGPLRILDEVDLQLSRGDNVAILGPSGSGKSTFLHIAGTLDEATSGKIQLNDENPEGLNEKQLAQFRNRNIGFIFQEHHLLPQLSAIENVLIPTVANRNESVADVVSRATSLLDAVGLVDRMDHRPAQLSGGERQRVAVARSLICKPVLLLADEPTGSLDAKNAQAVGELLLRLQQENNMMLICVTHSEKLAELFRSRVEIQNGKLVQAD